MKKSENKVKKPIYAQTVSSMVALIVGLIFALVFLRIVIKVNEIYPDVNVGLTAGSRC